MPAPIRTLIIRCWDHTPKKRPTVPEVLFSLENLIREELEGRTAQIASLRKKTQSMRSGTHGTSSMGSRVGSFGENQGLLCCDSGSDEMMSGRLGHGQAAPVALV